MVSLGILVIYLSNLIAKIVQLDALKRLVLRGVFSAPPAILVSVQKLCRLGLGKYKL